MNTIHFPIFVDGSKNLLTYGVLVMQYLEGHHLIYKSELMKAAEILADIHSVGISEFSHLINPHDLLKAVLEEYEIMVKVYYDSPLAAQELKTMLRTLMNKRWEKLESTHIKTPYECCIDTELNSTNFLANGADAFLVDWEKPIKGGPAQDIAHFVAPTTTFWKSDTIPTKDESERFIDAYIERVERRFDTSELKEHVSIFIPITCIRGITWCAMAWVQYQNPNKLITNESTWNKLNQYLDMSFLQKIYNNYFEA